MVPLRPAGRLRDWLHRYAANGCVITPRVQDPGVGPADERETFTHIVAKTPALSARRGEHRLVLADNAYYGRAFDADLAAGQIQILRPPRKGEQPHPGQRFKPLRQNIESVNDTFKGQLDLERHGGKTITGVCTRIAQRVLALTAAIWHNDRLGTPVLRSLTAYDH